MQPFVFHGATAVTATMSKAWSHPLGGSASHGCQPHMVALMSFFHGSVDHSCDETFAKKEPLEQTLLDIKHWMCDIVFSDPDPRPDDWPAQGHSSSLEQAEKAVSFFMPNKSMQWHDGRGNPTRSATVDNLMKDGDDTIPAK